MKERPYKNVYVGVVGTLLLSVGELWVIRKKRWDLFVGPSPICYCVGKVGVEWAAVWCVLPGSRVYVGKAWGMLAPGL